MKHSLVAFLRKNAIYLIIGFCVLAIGLSITLVLVNKNKGVENTAIVEKEQSEQKQEPIGSKDNEPVIVIEPEDEKIIFSTPVVGYSSYSGYSDTLHYNSTLKRYESHKAMDFFAEEGTNVCAVFGGVVESVTNDLLKGYTVTIDHGNGLKSIYNSLLDGDNVVTGQNVKKGDVIGEVSFSNRQEYKDGAHLHFAVTENGNYIDPETYLLMQDK